MTTQLLQQATQYHQAGQLAQAEALYRQVLQQAPTNVDALHLLGVIAFQVKNYDQAQQLIQRAIQFNNTVPYFYNNLGNVFKDTGRWEEAKACFQQAIALDANYPDAYSNLGNILADQLQTIPAEHCYRRAIALNPNLLQAYNGLGIVLGQQERVEEAMACFQRALMLQPNYVEALNNWGNVLKQQRRWTEAISCFQRALALNPQYAEAYHNLGAVFNEQGQVAEALEYFQRALTLNPNLIAAYNSIGNILFERGNLGEAAHYFQQALTLNPHLAENHGSLGNVFLKQHLSSEAIACYQRVLALKPEETITYNNLGMAFYEQGRITEAIACFRTAITKDPKYVGAHSNLLLMMLYSPDYDNEAIFAEHQRFNQQHIAPLKFAMPRPVKLPVDSAKRLKIGYLSADFHHHSVAYFMEPILAHHNSPRFEIYCYYNNLRHDDVTLRLQQYGHHWRDCLRWSDEELTEKIQADQIDILIDLTGQMEHNRLSVIGRRPAPLQMSYLGYSNSTGLTAIDYRLTDGYADPQGIAERFSSESLIRLSPSYFCYRPTEESQSVPVNPPPALQNGYVTFGSFNNYAKLSPLIIELWAQLLHRLPRAKLLIKARSLEDTHTGQQLYAQFAQWGIAKERLILLTFTPSTLDHLNTYHLIDIALDSFPYNGATTTCEALWMGVPVVTLVGQRHVSRMGLSILSAVGLAELVAHTPEDYLNICVNLANNLAELPQLRLGMRQRMQESPLLDAVTFTRQLEEVYQQVYQQMPSLRGMASVE